MLQLAPRTEHAVQFYDQDDFLCERVAHFIAEGLGAGEPALIIATDDHRDTVATQLRGRGCDLERVTFFDARELLELFMSGEMPDEAKFYSLIGDALSQRANGGGRIRAYGEMVDVLWRDGNHGAALRLEELWNDLATRHDFALLCGYQLGNSDAGQFASICATHSHVEISLLQQRAAALEHEIERRKALERSKDEFLATLSHELRTPLTAILGWSRMLTLGGLDDATRKVAYETIERSARMQATLIDDLLDLSRVVTGKLTLQNELVDLESVIRSAVQTLQLAADARGIAIDVRMGSEPAVVNGDPTRLQQIVWNLLSNAIKFSDAGARVSVELDGTQITVRDEGKGISPDFLPHVFEAFRQGDGASTRKHGGLGLGLAIVKYLTELHGGSVSATSEGQGCGATFTVTLPPRLQQRA